MNDEITDAFLRLEQVTSTLRGLVERRSVAGCANFSGDQALEPDGQVAAQARSQGPWQDATQATAVQPDRARDLEIVEAMISARGLRGRYFDGDLFFDPSWSILIDLYRAEMKGQRLSVTSVCYGSGVAGSTALRYIKALEDRGYIRRIADPLDKRRAFLRLTNRATEQLKGYFGSVTSQLRAA